MRFQSLGQLRTIARGRRARDDLEQVSVGVGEVHASSAVVAVDLAGLGLRGIRPVVDAALHDPPEDRVELALADQNA